MAAPPGHSCPARLPQPQAPRPRLCTLAPPSALPPLTAVLWRRMAPQRRSELRNRSAKKVLMGPGRHGERVALAPPTPPASHQALAALAPASRTPLVVPLKRAAKAAAQLACLLDAVGAPVVVRSCALACVARGPPQTARTRPAQELISFCLAWALSLCGGLCA